VGNDLLIVFLGWVGGILTSLFANWLFHKYLMWKKSKGEYFTTTVSGNIIEFEGRVSWESEMKVIIENIVEDILNLSLTQSSRTRKRRLRRK